MTASVAMRGSPGLRTILFRMLEREALGAVEHLTPVDPARADGVVADVYREIREDYALGGPMVLHSPSPLILAAMWAVLRETLIVGVVPRAHKEAVAASVSRINRCPYCVEAHGLSVAASGRRQAARPVEVAISSPSAMISFGEWWYGLRRPAALQTRFS